MACAQCHDHKFDPITQRDYYSLLDAFNRVPESGTPQFFSSRIRVAAPFIELPTEENKARIAELEAQIAAAERERSSRSTRPLKAGERDLRRWQAGDGKGLPEALAAILRKPEANRTADEKKSLDAGLRKHFDDKVRPGLAASCPRRQGRRLKKQLADYRGDQLPRVMVMSDARPRQTAILTRGEYLKPADKVSFATPAFLAAAARGSAGQSPGACPLAGRCPSIR